MTNSWSKTIQGMHSSLFTKMCLQSKIPTTLLTIYQPGDAFSSNSWCCLGEDCQRHKFPFIHHKLSLLVPYICTLSLHMEQNPRCPDHTYIQKGSTAIIPITITPHWAIISITCQNRPIEFGMADGNPLQNNSVRAAKLFKIKTLASTSKQNL